ncbi:MAG: zinc ribbon domain-containing protein [Pseudomonadota bacterium]
MPIYEFRCLKCNEIFELLFTSSDEPQEMKCLSCGGEDLERVLSRTNYTLGPSSKPQTAATTKTCGTGACSTLEIPGRYDR